MKKNVKKNKKKRVLKTKEIVALIVIGILAFIVILGVSLMPTGKSINNKNEIDLNMDLTTIQEVVEYYEATFIASEKSKVGGYDLDIYVGFPYNLYTDNVSQEIYFRNFYEKIAQVTKFKSFRMIDTSKDIRIEVRCENSKIKEVKINGEVDYYKKENSRRSKEKALKVKTLELEVNSPELQSLIDANWVTANVDLGTPESKFYKYDVYFDEGYEVRTIQGKVFNIVFNKKYGKDVVEDYKPGANLENVKATLGTSYDDKGIIGYKTKDFYVMFTTDEISIYPNRDFDYKEFEKLVKEYNDKKDINDFTYQLTDIWPDYDSYKFNDGFVEFYYTLKGVKISFSSKSSDGIQIYENYKGALKSSTDTYKDTYYVLDQNLMMEAEYNRRFYKELNGEFGTAEESIQNSDNFILVANSENNLLKNIKIYSRREEYPNNEFEDYITIKSYVWADNDHLVYSILNDGIYMYTATTRETTKLLEGKQTFEITNYNRNTKVLEYDGETVTISF